MTTAARAWRWTVAGHVRRATRGNAAGLRAPRILSWYARLGLLVVCTLAALPARAQDLPARVGRVNDFAEVLDAEQRHDLEGELAALERDTSLEVAVVTLRTLGGRDADEYAHELFNAWGIGKKGRANGMLILVAVQDRAVGIDGAEVGLPQGLSHGPASALMRGTFLPRLGTDDTYSKSLPKGMSQVFRWRDKYLRATGRISIVFCIFLGLAAFTLGTAAGAKVVVPLTLGAYATLGSLDAPQSVPVVSAGLAIGLVVLGFVLGRRPGWRRRLRGPGNDADRWIAETPGNSRYVLRLAAVASAYLSAGYAAESVALQHILGGTARSIRTLETLSATSISTGVATGALLVLGARMWPAIASVSFLFSLSGGIAFSLLVTAGGTVGSLTFWWLAKRYARGLKAFPHVDGVARFAACALVTAAVYATLGFFDGVASPSTWLSTFIASFLGIILVTPVITLWSTGGARRWSPWRGLEFAAVLAVTAVTGWFVFGNSPSGLRQYPIPFLVLPVLLWPAFRLGARETVTTTLLVSVIAITGSALGFGPFARPDIDESLRLVQLFLAVCALGALAVAAEVGRREAVEAEVRALNEDLEHRVSVRAQELVRAHATLRRARVRHSAAMRHVHARIASDLHDSVGASLSRIAILSDVALRESEASATATTGALAKIGDNARAVIDEMSDAVWFVDPRMEDVQQMVVRLRVVAAALFESNGTDWGIDAVSELLPLTLTPDQRRHLFLILKEALTNVHRHAHATVVRVTLSATDSGLRAVVEDNGTGMRPEHAGPGHGNGVANMQKRARELAGTLSMQSRPAIAGTRIVVDVPLRH